jgi:hypothetical protein
MFWTPAFAGVTLQETFYEIIKIDCQFAGAAGGRPFFMRPSDFILGRNPPL